MAQIRELAQDLRPIRRPARVLYGGAAFWLLSGLFHIGVLAMDGWQVARGLTNDELAEALFISENTVKTHVRRILTKLSARDRVQAVVMAYEGGLMDGS